MGIRNEFGAVWAAAALVLGCGASDDTVWGPVIGGNQKPVIEHLRIEHDDPEAPGVIRAVAEVRDPDGDDVELSYAWEVAGVPSEESGPELALPHARKGTRVLLRATASDGRARSETAERIVHMRNPRLAPVGAGWRPFELGETPESSPGAQWETAEPRVSPEDSAPESRASVLELESDATGEALRYAVEAPLVDGASSIRFRLLIGPEGMWVHPASGEVTWVPESWQTDTYPVEVEVSDADGVVSVEVFDVNAGFDEPAPEMPAKIATP